MVLDSVTVRNLELTEPVFAGESEATLVSVMDRTATIMGARLLKSWLLRPSIDRAVIEARLDAVEELVRQASPRHIVGYALRKYIQYRARRPRRFRLRRSKTHYCQDRQRLLSFPDNRHLLMGRLRYWSPALI
jgi:DNA mismatch repair ATPase MutS